jgi:Glycosyltransferase sugar-binding region containing DXD motif
MDPYHLDFESDEDCRSSFIREITLRQLQDEAIGTDESEATSTSIPRRLIRYWHDQSDIPDDVRACLDSWNCLAEDGFEFHMFDDASGAAYIANKFGAREQAAFERCGHPAMRSDYLRMCFLLAEGGLYVDADDVLLGEGWRVVFRNGRLKLQPLCYDIAAGAMLPSADIWRSDLLTNNRIFYVNNDPIAAPAGHPVVQRALRGATEKLLDDDRFPEIQSTTGPGNFTAALAAHARELLRAGSPADFELLHDWDTIAEMRWDLSYRSDARNWRNVYGC